MQKEFRNSLSDPQIYKQFADLNITKNDAEDLFDCFETDSDSTLSLPEFVDGCLRMQGPAKVKHLLQLQYGLTKLKRTMVAQFETTQAQLARLSDRM